ncbi:putative cyclase hisF [Synechococcus sp. BL107]|uniref:imidazole glycerol phosphate synthase cyclase subunit n=1 Tax=Synechococcus sp. BL107 TaxID=313625 RepID=UPI0000E53AF5|nr:imidazole glycerol phosphate synthase cyclase subunit [Synechococcus sp. BL107]EAU71036.1 putative cyclase hisF [Synechococcus sp. BL107]
MAKKRLIFTLLYQKGGFYLSRNFRLQKIGNLSWLKINYNFYSVACAIDELVILDVSREKPDRQEFCEVVNEVCQNCFMPLALGGHINSLDDAKMLIYNGADKLIINTALHENPNLVRELIAIYGSQCIIGSVDYKIEEGSFIVYTNQGKKRLDRPLNEHIERLGEMGVGELYLNSIDRDGTGQGYVSEVLKQLDSASHLPIIQAGGAGNKHHLQESLECRGVDAVATANLLNFVGDGLPKAREFLINKGISMAIW